MKKKQRSIGGSRQGEENEENPRGNHQVTERGLEPLRNQNFTPNREKRRSV